MALVRPSQVQRKAGGADGVPRTKRGQPYIIPKEGGKPRIYSRVSSFVECIDDKTNLHEYNKRMVMLGAATEEGKAILERALALDSEDAKYKWKALKLADELEDLPDDPVALFAQQYDDLAEELIDVAGRGESSARGTLLHEKFELADQDKQLGEVTDEDLEDVAAYKLATIDFEPLDRERFVVCAVLKGAGTADSIKRYIGIGPYGKLVDWVVVDDEKSGRVDYGGLKMSAQLAIYAHSEIYDYERYPAPDPDEDPKGWAKWKAREYTPEEAAELYSPLPDVRQDWGVITHVARGTGEVQLYWADLELGWRAALGAVEIRALRNQGKKALVPFGQVVAPNR